MANGAVIASQRGEVFAQHLVGVAGFVNQQVAANAVVALIVIIAFH